MKAAHDPRSPAGLHRPDLEALAKARVTGVLVAAAAVGVTSGRTPPGIVMGTKELTIFAESVAAHERARIATSLNALCDRGFEAIPIWKLREFANELEADHE